MFIIRDPDDNYQAGNTLEEAYRNYSDYHGTDYTPDECTWYEGTEIKVKTKIEKVEKITLTKATTKRS